MEEKTNEPNAVRAKAKRQFARTRPTNATDRSAEELLHELQVYQIELEMQNETLRKNQIILEESRDSYVDLYEFAPIGYLTLSRAGQISEINLTGAALLGLDRGELLRQDFSVFVAREDAHRWQQHFMAVLRHGIKLTAELCILRGDGVRLYVKLDSLRLEKEGKAPVVRIVLTDNTEHNRTQSKLELLNFAIDRSSDAMFLVDEQHRFTYVNAQACSSLGYNREELLEMSPVDIDPDVTHEMLTEMMKATFAAGGLPICIETRHRARDGRVFPVEVSASVIRYGEADFSFTVVRDITERKQTEKMLLQREQEFRSLAENLPDNIARWDRAGRYLYINPTHELTLGKPAAEVLGKRASEIFPDGRFDQSEQVLAKVVETGQAQLSRRQCLPQDDGFLRIHEVSTVPERNAQGEIVSVLGIGRDMTEQIRLQEALAAREFEFRSLAENMPDNIVRYNRQGVTVYVNPMLERTLGALSAAMIGTTPREYHSDGSYENYAQLLDTVLASGEAGELEKILSGPDGESSVHQIRMIPERGENGEIIGALAIGRDITERNHLEQQLRLKEFALDQASEAIYLIYNNRFVYVNEEACRSLGYSRDELLGLSVLDIDPDMTPEDLLLVKEQVHANGLVTFETRHRRRDGSVFPVEIRGSTFEYQGQIMSLTLARDITRRKRMEDKRKTHLRFFESMDRVNRVIQGANDLEQMMGDVLDIVLSIFDCDRAFLLYPCDMEADAWSVTQERTRPKYPGALAAGVELPIDEGIVRKFRALLDAEGPVQFGPETEYPLPAEVSERFGIKSLMSIALHSKLGKPWEFGIQQCSNPRVWTADEEMLLREIGRRLEDGLTSWLIHQDLQAKLKALVAAEQRLEESHAELRGLTAKNEVLREAERKHIAREVHDELGQILTSLRLNVFTLTRKFGQDLPALQQHLQYMLELVDKSQATARNLAISLRSATFDMGIVAGIEWVVKQFVMNTGISCDMHMPKEEQEIHLDESSCTALFRITQESLTNIARHAKASKVDITLRQAGDNCLLEIRDNGIGFNFAARKEGSFGLIGVRERVYTLGGKLSINSIPGSGTTIEVQVPSG